MTIQITSPGPLPSTRSNPSARSAAQPSSRSTSPPSARPSSRVLTLLRSANSLIQTAARPLNLLARWRSFTAPLSALQLRQILTRLITNARSALSKLAVAFALASGNPSGGVSRFAASSWVASMRKLLAPYHWAAGLIGLRGLGLPSGDTNALIGLLGRDEWATFQSTVESATQEQIDYLARFGRVISTGDDEADARVILSDEPLSDQTGDKPNGQSSESTSKATRIPAPWFVYRSQLYGSALWGISERIKREVVQRLAQSRSGGQLGDSPTPPTGQTSKPTKPTNRLSRLAQPPTSPIARITAYRQERRVLGSPKPCGVCKREAGKGWVKIGSLLGIGEGSPCQANDYCTFEYR